MFLTPGELALAGISGAIVGGVATGLFTTRASKQQTVTAKLLADEERRQERRHDAYITIQRYIAKWEKCAKWTTEKHVISDWMTPPPTPDSSEEPQAVVALMASQPVVDAMNNLNLVLNTFLDAYGELQYVASTNPTLPPTQKANILNRFAKVEEAAIQVTDAADVVHRQMRSELES
jgi:hypothetical protein